MSDLISRQAAIKAIHYEFDDCLIWDDSRETTVDEVERVLEELPTIEPKKGKWEMVEDYDGDSHYRCTACGEEWFLIEGTPKDNNMNYCPNCGADMREPDSPCDGCNREDKENCSYCPKMERSEE